MFNLKKQVGIHKMQIPEHPRSLDKLDLMLLLDRYGRGEASWKSNGTPLGDLEQEACRQLHANLVLLIGSCLSHLMDRVGSREMRTFTMHDSQHGLKVAHLMWHVLKPENRDRLTPPEIGILVVSAHLHDLGMGLSDAEREERLKPDSDLWDKWDLQHDYIAALRRLEAVAQQSAGDSAKVDEASILVEQAREVLLCHDSRERHATRARYEEILDTLEQYHEIDPLKVPSVETCLSFGGDGFRAKLIEVCVSHNEDAAAILSFDAENPDRPRFPTDYPVGACTVNLRLAAVLLRIADILDFDRERTPSVLFHYLLPTSSEPADNASVREWGKHLAISNWEIEDNGELIFRARCRDAVIHHTIEMFCDVIEKEIEGTRSIYESTDEWPLKVQPRVTAKIESEGYRYLPYRFSLDEERIYELLMGDAIYENPLDAVRELVQNSVDACQLKDALMRRFHPAEEPSEKRRIVVRLEDSSDQSGEQLLTVLDSGCGMDSWIIENYLLKVGRSFYKSPKFLRTRAELRKGGVDFNPVSEFGIGIMSCFMLGHRVEIETAAWYAPRGDNRRRILKIDGIGRLIELREYTNDGVDSWSGTRTTIHLRPASFGGRMELAWPSLVRYLEETVLDIPYDLSVEYVSPDRSDAVTIRPRGLEPEISDRLSNDSCRIPFKFEDDDLGMEGVIYLVRSGTLEAVKSEKFKTSRFLVSEDSETDPSISKARIVGGSLGAHRPNPLESYVIRGGFRVGSVPGLPRYNLSRQHVHSAVRLLWQGVGKRHLPSTTLSRTSFLKHEYVRQKVFEAWCGWFLANVGKVSFHGFGNLEIDGDCVREATWLEQHGALKIYSVARELWADAIFEGDGIAELERWEAGVRTAPFPHLSFLLGQRLLADILPRITKVIIGYNGRNEVEAPVSDWRAILESWDTFISAPAKWPIFARYQPKIADDLFHEYSYTPSLNIKFQNELSEIPREELEYIPQLLSVLIDAMPHKYQVRLTSSEHALLLKLRESVGGMMVSSMFGRWTVDELIRSNELSLNV